MKVECEDSLIESIDWVFDWFNWLNLIEAQDVGTVLSEQRANQSWLNYSIETKLV